MDTKINLSPKWGLGMLLTMLLAAVGVLLLFKPVDGAKDPITIFREMQRERPAPEEEAADPPPPPPVVPPEDGRDCDDLLDPAMDALDDLFNQWDDWIMRLPQNRGLVPGQRVYFPPYEGLPQALREALEEVERTRQKYVTRCPSDAQDYDDIAQDVMPGQTPGYTNLQISAYEFWQNLTNLINGFNPFL